MIRFRSQHGVGWPTAGLRFLNKACGCSLLACGLHVRVVFFLQVFTLAGMVAILYEFASARAALAKGNLNAFKVYQRWCPLPPKPLHGIDLDFPCGQWLNPCQSLLLWDINMSNEHTYSREQRDIITLPAQFWKTGWHQVDHCQGQCLPNRLKPPTHIPFPLMVSGHSNGPSAPGSQRRMRKRGRSDSRTGNCPVQAPRPHAPCVPTLAELRLPLRSSQA